MSDTRTGRQADDIRQENRNRLVQYFREGSVPARTEPRVGVEVEHFAIHSGTLEPIHYEPHGECPGMKDVLAHLRQFYPQEMLNPQGELLGLANETGSVTLEPAAQIEMSIAPYTRIADVERAYAAFREHVDSYLASYGCEIASLGYHPSTRALDMPLIPKQRYRFMDEYFATIRSHGERMMRASASTQVSVDYYSEEDAVRKVRIATAIGPVIAAICDNAPIFEGEPNGARISRLNLWRDVDDARCRAIPGVFDPEFGFEAYADWLLRTSPIFVTRPAADDPEGATERSTGFLSAQEAYADALLSREDIEHLISMFWPDVRLKRFVEIRQADCLPQEQMLGYAALVKGLYYSPASLSALEDALGVKDGEWPIDSASIDRAIDAIRADGIRAQIHGIALADWLELLFTLAREGLVELAATWNADDDETRYLLPLRERATSASRHLYSRSQ